MRNRIINFPSLNTDLGTLLLRLIFGGMFIYFGYGKLANYDTMLGMFGDPIGIGSKLSLNLTIFGEFFCGIFIALGFLTRIFVIPALITMIVAYFVAHANDTFQVKQAAFIYMVLCLPIFILGSGRFSIDYFLFKNKNGNR
jgi:putative oxidoreductase